MQLIFMSLQMDLIPILEVKTNHWPRLHFALRKARELRRLNDTSIKNGINIIIEGGIYQLHEPVVLRPEDSGT